MNDLNCPVCGEEVKISLNPGRIIYETKYPIVIGQKCVAKTNIPPTITWECKNGCQTPTAEEKVPEDFSLYK